MFTFHLMSWRRAAVSALVQLIWPVTILLRESRGTRNRECGITTVTCGTHHYITAPLRCCPEQLINICVFSV